MSVLTARGARGRDHLVALLAKLGANKPASADHYDLHDEPPRSNVRFDQSVGATYAPWTLTLFRSVRRMRRILSGE